MDDKTIYDDYKREICIRLSRLRLTYPIEQLAFEGTHEWWLSKGYVRETSYVDKDTHLPCYMLTIGGLRYIRSNVEGYGEKYERMLGYLKETVDWLVRDRHFYPDDLMEMLEDPMLTSYLLHHALYGFDSLSWEHQMEVFHREWQVE